MAVVVVLGGGGLATICKMGDVGGWEFELS